MTRKFSRWLRSKAGQRTLIGVLAVVLVVAVAGYFLGWWAGILDLLRGTAGPSGGYTCLPTCEVDDGKMLSMPGTQMSSFAGAKSVSWVTVPEGNASFELSFFDGDSGKDNSGNVNPAGGNWDNTTAETTYTLHADPLKDGSGTYLVGQWSDREMPNNDWFNITINNVLEARSPSGNYVYRLEITRPADPYGINALKLRSTGYLSTGHTELVDASFAIVGMLATINDVPILYPDYQGDLRNPGPSNYTGDWQFYLYVPEDAEFLEFWDGDFDRGTTASSSPDTDDFNTVGKPPWAGPYAKDERAGGRGVPADDHSHPLFRREPPVKYEIVDPDGVPIHVNDEPSGTEEWEKFLISTDPGVDADLHVSEIKPGLYNVHIKGLDVHNTVWIRANYCVSTDVESCLPPCEGACPRTIGYWKNNVNKIFIQEKTKGIQETRESIEAALKAVASRSHLYCTGIDVLAPKSIADCQPLTPEEADMILQRSKDNYPGDEGASQTMLARALQQNLATWLNWGSGKICDNTVISLTPAGGTFGGRIWDALQEAEYIILNEQQNDARMEYAKDIGDQINNGYLGEDAADSTCADYVQVMPPEEQPPKYEELPQAPQDPEPPNPVPQPITCDAPRVNTYGVENPTNNPFYGIKFEFQSGTEVKNSDYDEFKFVVTSDQAAAMTSVQVEAKAGQDQVVVTVALENCDFAQGVPCGDPIWDGSGQFAFQFMGAQDNGDGTLTLTFQVQNFTSHGLSHVTFGLPDGTVPPWPTDQYQSEVCP